MGLIASKEVSTTAFRSETAPFLSDSEVDHHCKEESHTIGGGGGGGGADDHSIIDTSERDGVGTERVVSRTFFGGTTKKSHLLLRNYILFSVILSFHQGAITTCLSYSDTQLSIHLGNSFNMLCVMIDHSTAVSRLPTITTSLTPNS